MKQLILFSCLLLTAISIYAGVGVFYSLASGVATFDESQNVSLDGRGGGYIAFRSERNGPNEALSVINADGTAQTLLIINTGRNVCLSFSSDGKFIDFSSNRTGDCEIYVISRDGSDEWRMTNS